ncbi:transcriptional repressor SdpR [bacterium BMS3Bbin11]|nr:transcriptional repressor SdpR [bacterium BMS3Abin11]GBE45524.1 transcriptional repressor SdpR [bacterium BMS3Bbin11]GMT40768.1 MAG: transcriptional regulator [bacterium]HDH16578.1 ArsR family transcriptional regulator [Gammaproteobacteria bacterium]
MNDICSTNCKTAQLIAANRKKISRYKNFSKAVVFYKLLGNQTRQKILLILIKSELCVCDIAESINLSVPATSQQLKMLKQAGILVQRNTGKMVYYSFANLEVEGVITSLLSNIIEKI